MNFLLTFVDAMRNVLITVFFVLFFLSSCMTENRLEHLFESEETASAQVSLIEKDSIQNPYMMRLVNNRLFMCNVFSPSMVTYFDWHTGKCLGNFGNKGVGKGEFINFNSVSVYDSTLVLFDGSKKECYFIPDVVVPTNYKSLKIEQVEGVVPFNIIALDKNLLIATGIIENARFALFDGNGRFMSKFGKYPNIENNASENSTRNAFAFQSHLSYEPNSKVLAVANAFGEGISFYQLEDIDRPHLIKDIFMLPPLCRDVSTKDKSSVVFSKDNIMGFVDICSYGNYFIGLFCGEKRERGNDWKGGDNLLVFDLKGNPVKRIKLSKRYLQMSVGDEDLVLLSTDNEMGDYVVDKIELDKICIK